MKTLRCSALLAAVASLSVLSAAQAATITFTGPGAEAQADAANAAVAALREFNVISFGNYSTSSHTVEGKVFVGGDLTGNIQSFGVGPVNNGFGFANATPFRTVTVYGNAGAVRVENTSVAPRGVTVGGNLGSFGYNANANLVTVGGSLSNTNLNANAGVFMLGGAFNGPVNPTPGVTLTQNLNSGPLIGGLTFQQDLQQTIGAQRDALQSGFGVLSTALSGLAGTDAPIFPLANAVSFSPVAAPGKTVAVYDIANFNATFGGRNITAFDLHGIDTVVFNIGGSSISWSSNWAFGNDTSLAGIGNNVIWNFYEATSVTAGTNWYGTILAPLASFQANGRIKGPIVANTFQQNAQVHGGAYQGNIDFAAVPEPATWAMMIGGLGLVGGVLRRRRAPVAA